MKCLSCNNYKYAAVDGLSCQLCSAITANCYDCDEIVVAGNVTGSYCTDCSSPYFANNGSCVICNDTTWNCAVCEEAGSDSFNCTTCNDGFWLNSSTARCVGCPSTCDTCSSETVCLTCINNGYYLNSNDSCVLCSVYDTNFVTC